MVQWRFSRLNATAIWIGAMLQQKANALQLIHVGKTGQYRRTILIGLNVRVGSARQKTGNYQRVKTQ